MDQLQNEFNRRVDEINQYFDFIAEIESDNVSGVETLLRPTLRASAILLLYNLLESSVTQAIDYIHITVSNDNLAYCDAIDEIKKIWIEYKYDNFKNQNDNSNQILEYLNSINRDIIKISDNSDSDRKYLNKIKGNSFAGNIDARKVKAFAEKYGFESNKRVEGRNLVKIKQQRNKLAHGEQSFRECGNNYPFSELNKYKREMIIFLKEFLCNINRYIKDKKYRLSLP